MKNIWYPQSGPQKALFDCPVYEIFYGGARGGGKTDGILGKMAAKAHRYGRAFNCIFIRHSLPMLDDAINRSQQIYGKIGAKYNEQKKTWLFSNGARIRFRHLENLRDTEKYQGQNLTDICIEEAGNYPSIDIILRLHAALRSASGVPVQMHLTGNPGGVGHAWLKQRFIDPFPSGFKIIKEQLPGGMVKDRVFIPARVTDNAILLANDPNYIGNLYLSGNKNLVKAWLDGDWSIIDGAYFDCWSNKLHVIRPFAIPSYWLKFRSFDWGSYRPFSVGWWAVSDGSIPSYPRGALVRYREYYGSNNPNKGVKLTAQEVAKAILARQNPNEKITYSVADPSIFKHDGGPSIAETMAENGVIFKKADNSRTGKLGAVGGWDMMRARLKGINSTPMIYCFDTCINSIRTIPSLVHDSKNPEDIDSNSEDHAADEWRYACMSRPWMKKQHYKFTHENFPKFTIKDVEREFDK